MNDIRNVLYEVKKESSKRSSPFYEPDNQRDQLRQELAQLRTQLRYKDTQIIRLHSSIDELKKKITLFEVNSKISSQKEQQVQEKQVETFSGIPMIFENTELKANNQSLHRENLQLNGRANELDAQLRQTKSEIRRQQLKLKELEILQKMREERFKDQVQKLTPIIIQQNKDFLYLKEGLAKLTNFLREALIQVVFDLFLKCAKECQKEKKVNSFSIFKNFWNDIKASKSLGFMAAVKAYEATKKLNKTLDEDYGSLIEQEYRDTMNQWIMNTLIDIRNSNTVKEIDQKLFRMLGLYYRSKFPIKGEKYEMDHDLKSHFEDLICSQVNFQLTK